MQGKDLKSVDVIVDTTAQEKNITFSTDAKLYCKTTEKINTIAEKEDIFLRQSYKRTIKKLLIQLRFSNHPRRKKQARKALKKLRIIAGRQIRDIERKLSTDKTEQYHDEIELFKRVVSQHRTVKTRCIVCMNPTPLVLPKEKLTKNMNLALRYHLLCSLKPTSLWGF